MKITAFTSLETCTNNLWLLLRSCFMPTDFGKTIEMCAPRGSRRTACWRDEFVLVKLVCGSNHPDRQFMHRSRPMFMLMKAFNSFRATSTQVSIFLLRTVLLRSPVHESPNHQTYLCHPDRSCEKSCRYPNLRKLHRNRNPRSAKTRAGRHENISTVKLRGSDDSSLKYGQRRQYFSGGFWPAQERIRKFVLSLVGRAIVANSAIFDNLPHPSSYPR